MAPLLPSPPCLLLRSRRYCQSLLGCFAAGIAETPLPAELDAAHFGAVWCLVTSDSEVRQLVFRSPDGLL